MGINLRRVQIGVSQHILNHAQIQAVLHQMRGKGVAQAVRADMPDTCLACIFFDNHPRQLPGNARFFLTDKQGIATPALQQDRTRLRVIASHPIRRLLPHRNHPLLVALAQRGNAAPVQIHIAEVQPDRLADAQAGCIH